MTVIEFHYEAKCKHCRNCETIRRKTYCTLWIQEPKTSEKIIFHGDRIRQNDKACKHFKL